MKRVTGIGGIFFRAKNIDELRKWYEQHLGIEVEDFGGHIFWWRESEQPERKGSTVWSPFPDDTTYFGDRKNTFMINYRVDNLDQLLEVLKQEGVQVDDKIEELEFGRFAWITDPEGNRIELWEPSEDN